MRILFILLLSLFASFSYGQQYSTASKSAIKRFEKALDYYKYRQNDQALTELEKALRKDENFIEAYLLRAEIYNEQNQWDLELQDFETVLRINPNYDPRAYFYVAQSYFREGRYENALPSLFAYKDFGDEADKLKRTEFMIACCEFALEAIQNPHNIELISLGNQVNTPYNDMMPALTANEEILIFTVDIPVTIDLPHGGRNRQEDFYFSRKISGEWTQSENLGPPINTPGNEGALTVSGDGTTLVFASSSLPDTYGSTDLYSSILTNNGWSKPINLGKKINSSHWDSQPSISADGKTLFFVSNRPGGFGNQDIWFSTQDELGNWQEPLNAGPNINTPLEENSPFFHHDGQSLYFSSNGHIGLGGMDLFRTKIDTQGNFSTPENLGYPINSHKNEEFLIINARGNIAYLSSERPGSAKKDLYSFEFPESLRPVPVIYVSGKVFDEDSFAPLFTQFTLIDLQTGVTVARSESSPSNGEYLVCLPGGRDYAFRAAKDGYLFYSGNFSLKENFNPDQPFYLDIPMQAIKSGKSVVLNNVFFDTDKFDLKEESKYELEHLVQFMADNPYIQIEIGGHTDNQGSASHNQILSENRAKSVYTFLMEKGVQKTRLSYRGYGMTQPIADNETETGRAKNRRTEFRIIEGF